MPRADSDRIAGFTYQAPVVLNQGAPEINMWYPLLPATLNCLLEEVQVNIEDTDENIEVRIIRDTNTSVGTTTCTHSTSYLAYVLLDAITRIVGLQLTTGNIALGTNGFPMEGRSIQVDVRKVTANGVGNLTGIATYGIKEKW